MKNYEETHVDFKNHAIQIPRKMQILRFLNLNNFFTDINMKNKTEIQKQCQKYIYFEKIVYVQKR